MPQMLVADLYSKHTVNATDPCGSEKFVADDKKC